MEVAEKFRMYCIRNSRQMSTLEDFAAVIGRKRQKKEKRDSSLREPTVRQEDGRQEKIGSLRSE
jgi:hypothetical protein